MEAAKNHLVKKLPTPNHETNQSNGKTSIRWRVRNGFILNFATDKR